MSGLEQVLTILSPREKGMAFVVCLEEKDKVKLLGTIITNDLKWEENTKELVRKANARMCLLRAVSNFNPPKNDLKIIYIQYVRSLLEQSCVLWHGSLTEEDRDNIERVQKNALRVILKDSFVNYEHALEKLDLETLEARREKLSLRFALKCQNSSHGKDLFKHKTKPHNMKIRNTEKYEVNQFNTLKYENSAIPYMQRSLNKHHKEKHETIES